ncbi:protein serine/threonine phosphatase 2C [Lenzites betulinus]|nr:protein serine/threonine phosphatase 2C [Lenzites betulinus]
MSFRRENEARRKILKAVLKNSSKLFKIEYAMFQPRGNKNTEDHAAMDAWMINGHRWLFMSVYDGHLSRVGALHASRNLGSTVRGRLEAFLNTVPGGQLDRVNVDIHKAGMAAMTADTIEDFDRQIGDALRDICLRPEELTEEEARRLIADHKDIVERAFSGTTVALALVNFDEQFMWAAGVGDSTVGLCTVGPDGKAQSQRLCDIHTFKDPRECARATAAHPASEPPLIDEEGHMLGWTEVPRAIGNFSMKLRSAYLDKLFRYLPRFDPFPYGHYVPKILTPPYIISEPSVHFTDLHNVWRLENKLVIFTNGVDKLVDGYHAFKPGGHSGADPLDVVSGLLAPRIEPHIEEILGHRVVSRWSREHNIRALDVLGNLLGGTDPDRLEAVTDLDRMKSTEGAPFYVDDFTIILWALGQT